MTDNKHLNPNLDSTIIDSEEAELRPHNLDSLIGQDKAKYNLRIFIESAKTRNSVIDHLLLYGPPGLGKTTIAQIIAKEMNKNFRATSGPMLSKAGDVAAILTNLNEGDVLFIDEIHRLHPSVEEVLYSAMEDFYLDIMIGEGPSARSVRIDLPKFTLIGATTRLGLISNPLKDRFGIPIRLNFYNHEELMKVVTRAGRVINIKLDEEGALEIARRSRGTPRISLRLLKRVADFATVKNKNIIDKDIADYALNNLEVDKEGLDSADHRYLRFIAQYYDGGPVGIETIAAGLSEQKDTIEETIEPYLLQRGFVQRTARGRVLTKLSFMHLAIELPKSFDLFNAKND